jgi:hypothetical protein
VSSDTRQPTWRYQRSQPRARPRVSAASPVRTSNSTPLTSRPSPYDPDESGWERFGKDTVWGALEGMFRSAYDYFRTRRWH